MKNVSHYFALFLSLLILNSCEQKKEEVEKDNSVGLKDAYKEDFLIGVALNASQIEEQDSIQNKLISGEFNSVTPENVMKSLLIHPNKDTYNFDLPDKLVALAEKNEMHIQGHTLVWHSQLSPFFKEISDSTAMVEVLKDHINTIVGRYKGKIDAWDVVNEALNDDGTLRKTVFLDVLGEDYLSLAFNLTQKADPEVELFYNDYSMTNPNKRAGAIRIIKRMQEQGVRVDGIGMQGHWDLNSPSIEEIETSIVQYAELGIKVDITELDVSVIPMPWDFSGADVNVKFESTDPTMNPYPKQLPDSIQDQLAKRYEDIFKLFLKHKDKINRVTFWGVNDGNSWKNDWPIEGRTNYPLLFDRNNKKKKAYHSLIKLKSDSK
ncbi:endo-1,4-beta-xylanase [Winogradskyella sp. SYSU M77433]|uniref:endo-1,4-beta-xylanase n=1 Tax=Winogradskyella sp. SYSU M77433 TaxID=3042722 RepID=UPI00248070F0|nr:endo-1,4-beta-xylanase [Winogradskyella sp. SYSU M77433]MDH7911702.1 endo-1,4-beta-xylanase [Winogradskyella sp. SYSU M77433]